MQKIYNCITASRVKILLSWNIPIIKKPVKLKSDRLIKDLESANQWIADIGYDKAIRLDYDGENHSFQTY